MNKLNKLKKVSISLVLLNCFAVTSKMGAMDPVKLIRTRIDSKIKKISETGLQEKDLRWIINELNNNFLNINDLQDLIKLGLTKYINYKVECGFFGFLDGAFVNFYNHEGHTLLKSAIKNNNLEMVKLLISVGAYIDEDTLKTSSEQIKITNEELKRGLELEKTYQGNDDFEGCFNQEAYENMINSALEIKKFLIRQQELKTKLFEKITKPTEKPAAKTDTRIHCVNQ